MLKITVCLAALSACSRAEAADDVVLAVYLTWQRDPATTMTVQWHSPADRKTSVVNYRANARLVGDWQVAEGTNHALKDSDRQVHWVELAGLEPDTTYEFRIGEGETVYKFRTLPAGPTRPIRFAVSGDVYKEPTLFARMNRLVAARDADFVVFGGDVVYTDYDTASGVEKWYTFLDVWQETMVAPDGRLIPLVAAIGNHEVPDGGFGKTPDDVPYFYDIFAFPGRQGYNTLDLGKYLSLVLLDTDHSHPLEGEQSDWLDQTLADRQDVTHLLCVYHVPAWPSARSPMNAKNRAVRKAWVPIFEKHNVDICFEHHDHAFKRTHPIRDNEIDPHGVVYLGDGGYSVNETRRPKAPGQWWNGGRWYLANSGQVNFFWFVTLDGDGRKFEAVDPVGHVFDTYTQVDGVDAPTWLASGQGKTPLWMKIVMWVVIGLVVLELLKAFCKRKPAKAA